MRGEQRVIFSAVYRRLVSDESYMEKQCESTKDVVNTHPGCVYYHCGNTRMQNRARHPAAPLTETN